MRSDYIDMPEGKLHALSKGDRGGFVLLLSGAALDNALLSWRHLIPHLAKTHQVIAIDWPRQGQSSPWSGIADHDVLLRCIDATLQHFNAPRASLVGLSQGGAMALAYAMENPAKVEKLVAIAPGGIMSFRPVVHQFYYLIARLQKRGRNKPPKAMRRPILERLVKSMLFRGPSPHVDEVTEELLIDSARYPSHASDWQIESIGPFRMKVDLRSRLRDVKCPTLFIQGDKDIAVNAKFTRRAAELVPNARIEVLKDHGHWPNRQSPEIVNILISEFLADARG